LLCDSEGHPLCYHLTPGQTHESTVLDVVLNKADHCLVDRNGIRVSWPSRLAGDKGYRADWIDTWLMDLDILPVIPKLWRHDKNGVHSMLFEKDMIL